MFIDLVSVFEVLRDPVPRVGRQLAVRHVLLHLLQLNFILVGLELLAHLLNFKSKKIVQELLI